MQIETESGLSLSFYVDNGAPVNMTWKQGIVVVFALEDGISLQTCGQNMQMRAADIVVINPYEPYGIDGGKNAGNMFILLEMPSDLIRPAMKQMKGRRISCCSIDATENLRAIFDEVRCIIADMFMTFYSENAGYELTLLSQAYRLLGILTQYFSKERQTREITCENSSLVRMHHISEYIKKNYMHSIRLDDLARHEFLSPNYLSQFFKRNFGVSFSNYLSSIRLASAYREICETSRSVGEIALDNGFGKASTLIALFREQYGMTPRKYRQMIRAAQEKEAPKRSSPTGQGEQFDVLLRYYECGGSTAPIAEPLPADPVLVRAELRGQAKPCVLHHNWKRLINIGYAKEGLSAAVQNQLRLAQQEIGFKYLRFHGIFSDEMQVYHEEPTGEVSFNFSQVDMLLDFVFSIKLIPFLELGYMPSQLARDDRRVFQMDAAITPPNNYEKWNALVRAFLLHCVNRYGLHHVRRWYFTTINMNYAIHGFFTEEEFFELYWNTCKTVKQVDSQFRFGGPGTEGTVLFNQDNSSLPDFLKRCAKYDCVPDFFSLHAYPHNFENAESELFQLLANKNMYPLELLTNEDFIADILKLAKALLEEKGLGKTELILVEWASTVWQRDPHNDTCYKSSFITKQILENYDQCAMMGYWLLTDYFGEWPFERELFHGGYGLLTYNGIRKSGFQAMTLLNRLGNRLLCQGKGFFITEDETGVQVMLYNYCAYNRIYNSYAELVNRVDRYSVFARNMPAVYELHINGFEEGTYKVCVYSITRQAGSAFDCWVNMGAPEDMTAEEINLLHNTAVPGYVTHIEEIRQEICIQQTVLPHEVYLIRISKIS